MELTAEEQKQLFGGPFTEHQEEYAAEAEQRWGATDAAEAHRQHITRWFHDVPLAMHRGLGDMSVVDPRFTATYEVQAEGLASYLRDAIQANADRREAIGHG